MTVELSVVSVAHTTGSPDAPPNGTMIMNRGDDVVIREHLDAGFSLAGVVPVQAPQPGVRLYFTRPRPIDPG